MMAKERGRQITILRKVAFTRKGKMLPGPFPEGDPGPPKTWAGTASGGPLLQAERAALHAPYRTR